VIGIVVDADVAELRLRRVDFGFAGLEIAREMGNESAGNLVRTWPTSMR
jgi:hypothetical protein